MNGAPGGRRQNRSASSQKGAIPTSQSCTTSALQTTASASNFQPTEALALTTSLSQSFLGGGVLQHQIGAPRDSSIMALSSFASPSLQRTGVWSPHLDLQNIYSSQIHPAQSAAALHFAPASNTRLSSPSEVALTTSSHQPGLTSSAPPNASGLMGIQGTPNSFLSSMHSSPSSILGSVSPAILFHYQLMVAAAQRQALIIASNSQQTAPIVSRPSISTIPSLPSDQNLQRYIAQLQQQMQLGGTLTGTSHLYPAASSYQSHTPSSRAFDHLLSTQATLGSTIAPIIDQPISPMIRSPELGPATQSFMVGIHPRQATITASNVLVPSLTTFSPSFSGSHLQSHPSYDQPILMPPLILPTTRYNLPGIPFPALNRQRLPMASLHRFPCSASSFNHLNALLTQPHYPAYFKQGTIVRLQSGQLKRIEDMNTEDFIFAATTKSNVAICNSTVIRIQVDDSEQNVTIGFNIGEQNIFIHSLVDYPFFVVGQGWTAVNPEKARSAFDLICRRLVVGDVCLLIRHERNEIVQESDPSAAGFSREQSSSASALHSFRHHHSHGFHPYKHTRPRTGSHSMRRSASATTIDRSQDLFAVVKDHNISWKRRNVNWLCSKRVIASNIDFIICTHSKVSFQFHSTQSA